MLAATVISVKMLKLKICCIFKRAVKEIIAVLLLSIMKESR